jgi:AbrB family looped-hinge helix DNA binding protein
MKEKGIPMAVVRVKQNYQITIPHSVRKRINLAVGDYVEVDSQNGEIIMRPVKMVHPDQEYFYTKEWQEGEAQADRDIASGEVVGPFDNIKDSLRALKKAKV